MMPNPDPLRPPGTDRYVVPPTRVDPLDDEDLRSGHVIVWILGAAILFVLLVIAGIASVLSAPRSAPAASVSPQARTLIGAPYWTSGVPPSLLPAAAIEPPEDPTRIGAAPALIRGWATWYDAPTQQDAAAGPLLRRALGSGWRGSWVRVSHVGGGRVATVTVRLTDWCACGQRGGQDTVIDLDDQAFRELAPLGRGVIRVQVEAIDGVPLPATGTEP